MKLIQNIGLIALLGAFTLFLSVFFLADYTLTDQHIQDIVQEKHLEALRAKLHPYVNREYSTVVPLVQGIESAINDLNVEYRSSQQWDKVIYDPYPTQLLSAAASGLLTTHTTLIFLLVFFGGSIAAMLFLLPDVYLKGPPGIKNNHIFHNPLNAKGWIGLLIGVILIGFYLFIYFFEAYLTNWIILVQPLKSLLIPGSASSQWFLYGVLYTFAVLVMGVRMLIKYRHSRYQQVRSFSVMFFQTTIAFLIPEILVRLNQPYFDFKNMWPLDYDFFDAWHINMLTASGGLGIFMFVWGVTLFVIGVPLFTYLYGKRWYCSWVCGCGGLAETAGDPFRQLSDKSTEAWQIERFIIHGVLAFGIIMTALVLYNFYGGDFYFQVNKWLVLVVLIAIGAGLYAAHRKYYPDMKGHKIRNTVLAIVGISGLGIIFSEVSVFSKYMPIEGSAFSFSSGNIRTIYGFMIGALFSGVVGTGFYPLMGNRVWCRFGCPLAAYLGLVQRFKSRFRITTNGGQCISCGNCSTYCEMGIDVRAYAQKGQNIIRSSCVGCGVCSAVCPRGVLNLENGKEEGRFGEAVLIGNDSISISK